MEIGLAAAIEQDQDIRKQLSAAVVVAGKHAAAAAAAAVVLEMETAVAVAVALEADTAADDSHQEKIALDNLVGMSAAAVAAAEVVDKPGS